MNDEFNKNDTGFHAENEPSGPNASDSGNAGFDNAGSDNGNTGNGGSGNSTGNFGSGSDGSGSYNSGNYNSGNYNPGNYGSGNYNSGNYGSGNYNPGNYNSGNDSSVNGGSGSYHSDSGDSGNAASGAGASNDNAPYGGNTQYKWYYDDYQKALERKAETQRTSGGDGAQKPPKKKKGLKPFLITVASVFGVAVLGLAVVGATSLPGLAGRFGGKAAASASSSSSGSSGSGSPSLPIAGQPSSGSSVSTTGEMTATQVATKLTPAVVGVVDYSLQSVEPTAEGSGIVMTDDGYIITNAHVISGAQVVQVVVPSGKTYTARVVGSDTKTDLAVLKVNTNGVKLKYATFGNSSQLQIGQNVIAIGNPGGLTLAGSVTNGIISGLNRQVGDTDSSMTFIQTNALINPGNSGGPLVNMYGQVVGINSSKIEETGYEGIGFAIPINTAKPIIDSLIQNGYVTGRVKVGISVYPLSTAYTQQRGYPSGLYVQTIDTKSDAYAKGLRVGDIITKANGISLSSDDSSTVYEKFYQEESKYKVGQSLTLTVYRTGTGNTLTMSIKLMEDKGTDTTSSSDNSSQYGNGNGGSGSGYSGGSGSDGSDGSDGSGSDGNSGSYWGFGQ